MRSNGEWAGRDSEPAGAQGQEVPALPAIPVPAIPVPAIPVPAIPVPAIPVPAIPVPAIPVPAIPVPAIPVSAGALIFDREGRLLILKPTYKPGWTIPGGVMEADGETPWEACRREVREECGLEVSRGKLACMDFRRPRPGRPGGVRFLFDCGALGRKHLGAIVLQPEEIAEYRLAELAEALPLLRGPIRRRVRAACAGRGPVYLEDGRRPKGVGRRPKGVGRRPKGVVSG